MLPRVRVLALNPIEDRIDAGHVAAGWCEDLRSSRMDQDFRVFEHPNVQELIQL